MMIRQARLIKMGIDLVLTLDEEERIRRLFTNT